MLSSASPAIIKKLEPHQIFVFGSNTEGRHGRASARQAIEFGAQYGNPEGRQGQSYAIITKDLTVSPDQQQRSISLPAIGAQILKLCQYAKAHSDLEFLVTKIGCGLGGYDEQEIGALWVEKPIPENIHLPEEFIKTIKSLQSQPFEFSRYPKKNQPHYELSSHGDKRFSALYAQLADGRTIEAAYQLDVKGFRCQGNNWQIGKGKPPLNALNKDELYKSYRGLWEQWAEENPDLIQDLAQKAAGCVLTDKFASSQISQARALAEILNQLQAKATPQVEENKMEANSQIPASPSPNQDLDKQLKALGFARTKLNETTLQYDAPTIPIDGGLAAVQFDRTTRSWAAYNRFEDDLMISYTPIPRSDLKGKLDLIEAQQKGSMPDDGKKAPDLPDQSTLLKRLNQSLKRDYQGVPTTRLFLEPEVAEVLGLNATSTGSVRGQANLQFENKGWDRCDKNYQCPLTHQKYPGKKLLLEVNFHQVETAPIEDYRETPPINERKAKEAIVISCDGACSGNPGPGGWGTIIQYPNQKEEELGGFELSTTNNRMELRAVIEGIKHLTSSSPEALKFQDAPIIVIADSKYVIDGATGKNQRHANKPLWEEYENLDTARVEKFHWVKGHGSEDLNIRADSLAVKQRDIASNLLKQSKEVDHAPTIKPKSPTIAGTVYLSLVKDQVKVHLNWDECKAAIQGQSKAQSKKCKTADEIKETLVKWGKDESALPQNLGTPPLEEEKISKELLRAVGKSYEQIRKVEENAPQKSIRVPIGDRWAANVQPTGETTVRTEARNIAMKGNCLTEEVTLPLSRENAKDFQKMRQTPVTQPEAKTQERKADFEVD